MSLEKDNTNRNNFELEVNISDIIFRLWKGKHLIFIISFIFLILGFVSLRFSTHTYEVKLNVIEVPNSQSSSSKKNISSIAQIVGIGSNSQNVLSNFELYKKMFNSRVISEELF